MNKREYIEALDKLEGQISQAFLRAVQDRVERASVREIEAGIVARDIEAILRAAGLTGDDLTRVIETVRGGFLASGASEAAALRVVFGGANSIAQDWLQAASSRMVVEITGSQREALRIALNAGYTAGRNPRSVALDIVGRIGTDRKRTGGIVGLTEQASGWVANAREELTALDASYFTRKARDKRFDSIIRKAIKDGKPLPAAKIDAIVSRYAARLLKLRGDAIGRTEALTAIAAGREIAFAQAIARGELLPQDITRTWDATNDGRTRNSHMTMEGQRRGWAQPFTSGLGASLNYPGDSSLGAPAADTIQCRCMVKYKIDHIGRQIRKERGKAI